MESERKDGRIEFLLLDLLIDGPSSFAALFGSLCGHYGFVETSAVVDMVIDALTEMSDKGWVKPRLMTGSGMFSNPTEGEVHNARLQYREWLPVATPDQRSLDEVGLWYMIMEGGRDEWESWSKRCLAKESHWSLDDDSVSEVVTIRAATLSDAKDALSNWAVQNPCFELLVETQRVAPLRKFRLRTGVLLADGVSLTCSYRPHIKKETGSE